jgi:hypothetical protein
MKLEQKQTHFKNSLASSKFHTNARYLQAFFALFFPQAKEISSMCLSHIPLPFIPLPIPAEEPIGTAKHAKHANKNSVLSRVSRSSPTP